ncbi:LysR family transcriptional regulator [Pseudomonas sp. JS3066]|jgi:DNA-binding transcriptional LysR family regulator|uniref:LysR family transcriptional regulator n=1 Tax=unclassified Pseudomonas TaxID=196821 RepID=UPI000EA99574|nr:MULTISPECIES: LysR family transcriptional regulator [unclassified Pseudomonas]AYF86105.1 LysR family transcriptional regulator [Pseudomonas sp. DY-1]MDH4654247.1 LysR family transcriptional regulator [Pseudomonas sp. BN606]MRK19371.1 LysR family transcriptional regulator [Pseudomonas sp. JG-B]WVK91305.1 LysR family transcriptional regulator [Pseudomonas sp. JS3066]
MNYSPESLEAFVHAVALGSFSAAARKLGKSQSTVSEAIARLEIDLGLELFDRSSRQPQLTDAGRVLLDRVEEILAASDRLQHAAAQLAGGLEPRVSLALSDAYQSGQYEERLAEMDQRYPDLEFECLIAEHNDVIELVAQGRATLGLLASQGTYPPELGAATVAERADFGLFVAQEHPLAQMSDVQESDLAGWRLLRLNTLGNALALDDGLPNSGGRCWSAPSYLLLLEMASNGFGWAELPRWLVSGYANGRLKELQVPGWPRSQAVDVVWSRQRRLGPAASWLLGRLLDRPAAR